jgi:hypothetical protein
MWNWYNRPGGRESIPTRYYAIALLIAGILISVFFFALYSFLAPHLFTPVPTR